MQEPAGLKKEGPVLSNVIEGNELQKRLLRNQIAMLLRFG